MMSGVSIIWRPTVSARSRSAAAEGFQNAPVVPVSSAAGPGRLVAASLHRSAEAGAWAQDNRAARSAARAMRTLLTD
jgi:hypothetical protein